MDGVEAIDSAGHTPGHIAYLLSFGDSQLLHVGDAIANPLASMPHPEWNFSFDGDPDLAVTSRKALLTRLSDEKIKVLGYHFPFPSIGYAVRDGEMESWHFYPASV
jgi:glyoxylase-like metal-dependent hydrolase (beta-lactamase superfamily II)